MVVCVSVRPVSLSPVHVPTYTPTPPSKNKPNKQYVGIRDTVRRRALESEGEGQQTVPITVRQLEALVRISESLAKMRLRPEVGTKGGREREAGYDGSGMVVVISAGGVHSGRPPSIHKPSHLKPP